MTLAISADLHQVVCTHCGKVNITGSRRRVKCKFCGKFFQTKPKTSKYHNKKVSSGAITFDSKAEEKRYYQLKGDPNVSTIEVHPIYEIFPALRKCIKCGKNYEKSITKCPICGKKLLVFRAISYIADFKVTYQDGHVEIEDVKGVETEVFKMKRKLFEAAYPALNIKVVYVR